VVRAVGGAATQPRPRLGVGVAWPMPKPDLYPITRPVPISVLPSYERLAAASDLPLAPEFGGPPPPKPKPRLGTVGSIGGIPVEVSPPNAPEAPPPKGTREGKRGKAGAQAFAKALGMLEARDPIAALYGALSGAAKARNPCRGSDTACQINALWENPTELNALAAALGVAAELAQDQAYGRIHGRVGQATQHMGVTAGYQNWENWDTGWFAGEVERGD